MDGESWTSFYHLSETRRVGADCGAATRVEPGRAMVYLSVGNASCKSRDDMLTVLSMIAFNWLEHRCLAVASFV